MSVSEPRAIDLSGPSSGVSTALPLLFDINYPPKSEDETTPKRLSPEALLFDVIITWKIKSLTIISARPLGRISTLQESRDLPFVAWVTKCGNPVKSKFRLADWDMREFMAQTLSQPLQSETQCYSLNMELLLFLPRVLAESRPPPTFSSPYLLCRYSILAHMKISGPLGTAMLDFNVPIQILYATASQNPTHTSPHTPSFDSVAIRDARRESGAIDDRERLPAYSP